VSDGAGRPAPNSAKGEEMTHEEIEKSIKNGGREAEYAERDAAFEAWLALVISGEAKLKFLVFAAI
jgi:hypothetical protein